MMDTLSKCVLCFSVLAVTHAKITYLFGASPNGGVWGGALETTGTGSIDPLDNTAYPDLGPRVGTMSYDSHGKQVLMEVTEPHSLVYGPLCTGTKDLPHVLTNLTKENILFYNEDWGDCINCAVGAFTLHHSKIYFLLVGEYMSGGVITRSIQVRLLQNCEKCPDTPGRSNVDKSIMSIIKCSKVVSNVHYKAITLDQMDDIVLKVSKSMKIIKRNRALNFYFNIANITSSEESGEEVRMELYKATSKDEIHMLHSETVDSNFADWDVSALGSVDVKDGMVCWTAADRLYCAEEENNQLQGSTRDVRVMIPGQGAASQVCLGDNYKLLGILTGITMLEVGEEVQLVFSCYPQERNLGGVGLIKMSRDRKEKQIYPVKFGGDKRALAGSLFHVNLISATCSFDPQPHICLPHEPTEVNFPDPTTPVAEPEKNVVDGNKVPRDGGNPDNNEVDDSEEDTEATSGKGHATSLVSTLSLVISLCSLSVIKILFSIEFRL